MQTDKVFKAPLVDGQGRLSGMNFKGDAEFTGTEMMEANEFATKWLGIMMREASVVENTISSCVLKILGPSSEKEASFFMSRIVRTSFMSLENMRYVIIEWVKLNSSVIQGKKLSELEKKFSQYIKNRNIAAHGLVYLYSDKEIYIEYFRGGPQKVKFDGGFINESSNISKSLVEDIQFLSKELSDLNWQSKN